MDTTSRIRTLLQSGMTDDVVAAVLGVEQSDIAANQVNPQANVPVIASGAAPPETGYFWGRVVFEPKLTPSTIPLRGLVSGDLAWTIDKNGKLSFPPGTYRFDARCDGTIRWYGPPPAPEDFVWPPRVSVDARNSVDYDFLHNSDEWPSRYTHIQSISGLCWYEEPGGLDFNVVATQDHRVEYHLDLLMTRLGDFNGEFREIDEGPGVPQVRTSIFHYYALTGYQVDTGGAPTRVGVAWDLASGTRWATHVELQPGKAVSNVHVYLYDGGASGNAPTNLIGHGTPPGVLVPEDWNRVALDRPVAVVPGRKYFAVAYLPNGGYLSKTHVFDSAVPTVYPGTALRGIDSASVSPGNGIFFEGTVADPANPDNPAWTSVNNTHYGIDVLLTDADPT